MREKPKSIVFKFVEPNGLIRSELTLEIPNTPRPTDPLQDMFEGTTAGNRWKEKAGELLSRSDFDPVFRNKFHSYWTVAGHCIREQINDDRTLVLLLRRILPPYAGPSLALFRGENLDRWNSRRIGLCWSINYDTAHMFGGGRNSMMGAGGVLLRCTASSNAIIAGPSRHSLYLDESEYTLDPSMITEIKAMEHFPRWENR